MLVLFGVIAVFAKIIIDLPFDYFVLFLIAICLMLLNIAIRALLSINTVYKHIVIATDGIWFKNILRIGKAHYYKWSSDITRYRLGSNSSLRLPKYKNNQLKFADKRIVELDELTYRNYTKTERAIVDYIDASGV